MRGIGEEYTNKVDIWALGCIFYEIIFWKRAFVTNFAVTRYADRGKEFEISFKPDIITDEKWRELVSGMIKELLDIDPNHRPKASDLYECFISLGSDQTTRSAPAPSSQATMLNHPRGLTPLILFTHLLSMNNSSSRQRPVMSKI